MSAAPRERPARTLFALALAAAAALFVLHAAQFAGYAQDDAFISFTYARHLIDDGALTYRLDERTIGYSNLLWVLLAAPVYALAGAHRLLAAMQLLGVAAGALLTVATGLLARRLGAGRVTAAVGALLVAATSPLAIQAQSGLETTLFALLLVVGTLGIASALADESSPYPGVAAFVGVALIRPEGLAYLALGLATLVFARPREASTRRAIASALAVVGIAGLALFAAHGTIVPNTVVAKLGAGYPLGVRLGAGLDYALEAARAIPVLWLLPLAVVTIVGHRRSAAVALTAGVALAPWVESVAVGGDAMPGYRFVAPGVPLLVALAMAALPRLSPRMSHRTAGWLVGALAVGFALGAQWLVPTTSLATAEVAAVDRNARLVAGYVEVAKGLAPICSADRSGAPPPELATDVAGAFAFFTDCRVLDTWGLASEEIARRGRAFPGRGFVTFGVVAPEVLLERRPALLLPFPPVPMPVPWGREPAIAALFPAGYYVGWPELEEYDRAVVTTAHGAYAYLRRRDFEAAASDPEATPGLRALAVLR